jgi:ribosome-associated protein
MVSTANNANEVGRLFDIAALIDEHKGEGTVILDVTGECSFADYFIITTARSSRHLASLIGHIRDYLHDRQVTVFNRIRPDDQSGWSLLDCGYFVVHVMEQAVRSFYELEKLWFRSKTLNYSSKSS